MRLQLHLSRGDAVAMEKQLRRMPAPTPPTPCIEGAADTASARSPVYCARRLLMEVEWHCLIKNYYGIIIVLLLYAGKES